jgi:hypothetical protein
MSIVFYLGEDLWDHTYVDVSRFPLLRTPFEKNADSSLNCDKANK